MRKEEILAKFELQASSSKVQVFGKEIIQASQEIEKMYRNVSFDHRKYLSTYEEEYDAKLTEEYRVGHACFKYAVSKVLKPKLILEIGVGSGTSAMAFLAASPTAKYVGVDNGEWSRVREHDFLFHAQTWMGRMNYKHSIIEKSSMEIENLKPEVYDLVHIDGDHSREVVRHDFTLVWRSGAKWILCDDSRDSAVVAGIFDSLALDLKRGSVDWAYFSDTWSGNILVRTDLP